MVRARPLAVVAGVGIALWSVVGVVAAAATDPRDEPSEREFLDRANAARSAEGRASLAVAPDLVDVARRHSARMARERRLYHNPALGDEVSGWQVLGENVGAGGDVASVHDAFMRSQVHRDDILDARFTEVGVGVVWDGSTLWVTEVFRQPSATSTAPPAPPPAPAPPPPPPPPPPSDPAPRALQSATPPPAPAPPPAPPAPAVPAAAAATAPAGPPPAEATVTTAAPAVLADRSRSVGRVAAASIDGFVLGATHEQALAVPAGVPRIPVPVGVAAGLLALVVAAQGAVVRRLGLA